MGSGSLGTSAAGALSRPAAALLTPCQEMGLNRAVFLSQVYWGQGLRRGKGAVWYCVGRLPGCAVRRGDLVLALVWTNGLPLHEQKEGLCFDRKPKKEGMNEQMRSLGMNGIDWSFTTKLYHHDAFTVAVIVWIIFHTDCVPRVHR